MEVIGLKQKYWNMYSQLNFDSHYLALFLKRYVFWSNLISVTLAVLTSGSVTAWVIWQSYPLVWAIIVAFSQIAFIIKDHLPFLKYISPLKYLLPELEKLLLDIDYTWEKINHNSLSDNDINDLVFDFEAKWLEIKEKYTPNLSLHSEKIRMCAHKTNMGYFAQKYNLIIEKGDNHAT